MNKQTKALYTQVYGNGFKEKTAQEMAATASVRTPNGAFRDGDEFEFLKDFAIVDDSAVINGEERRFDTFVVLKNGKPTKFFVNWLAGTGFPVYVRGTQEECAKVLKDGVDELDNTINNANNGDIVKLWQESGTQAEAIKAVSGKKVKVSIQEYTVGQFDTRPKPVYTFEEV